MQRIDKNNYLTKKNTSKRLLAYMLFFWVVICLVTVTLIIRDDLNEAKNTFQSANNKLVEAVANRILIAETVLEGFAAHLEEGISEHAHFSHVATNLLDRYPYLYMFEIAERVNHENRGERVRQLRKIYPGFYIRRFDYADTRQWIPSEDKSHYYPITFQPQRGEPGVRANQKA